MPTRQIFHDVFPSSAQGLLVRFVSFAQNPVVRPVGPLTVSGLEERTIAKSASRVKNIYFQNAHSIEKESTLDSTSIETALLRL